LITAKVTYDKLMPAVVKLMPTDKDMIVMADQGRNIIINRTLKQNVDADGKKFDEYSEAYRDKKVMGGRDVRNPKGRIKKSEDPQTRTAAVNLNWSGRMLGAMAIKGIANGAEIYFSDGRSRELARYHNNGMGNNPQREFFGLSDSDIVRLLNALIKKLQARAAK
jgi:hypothetical protein